MKKYVIALDEGTTSARSVLIDHSGKIAGVAQREFEQHYPHPGWVEHDPQEILSAQLGTMTDGEFISNEDAVVPDLPMTDAEVSEIFFHTDKIAAFIASHAE